MWDLPGPGLELVFPALTGRFLTTAPPGKPSHSFLNMLKLSLCFIKLTILQHHSFFHLQEFVTPVPPCKESSVCGNNRFLFVGFWLVLCFFFFFFLLVMPRGIQDLPRPGIEPEPPPAVEAWSLNHWTAGEVLVLFFYNCSENSYGANFWWKHHHFKCQGSSSKTDLLILDMKKTLIISWLFVCKSCLLQKKKCLDYQHHLQILEVV